MGFSVRTVSQESEFIQDSLIDTLIDNEGDVVSSTQTGSNQSFGKLARWLGGLKKLIGDYGRRHGATFFTGLDLSLTGTITSSGATVTGSSTLFTTELAIGDLIAGTTNDFKEVLSISSNTSLTLVASFASDIVSAQSIKRRPTLAERLDSFIIAKGLIIGGLQFNSNSLPPKIKSGTYEVNGKSLNLNSDAALALTDTIQQSKQTFDSYCQYLVCVDNSGSKKYVLSGEGAISGATGGITTITGAGTSKTLTVSSGTVGSHTGKILVITGNDGVNGVFKITGGNGSTTYTFESVSGATGTAAGTWTVFERIKTLHGTGTSTAITTDADVLVYSPSYGESGFDAGIATWNDPLQGYYLTISGLTGYRVIGNFRTNGSSNVLANLIQHRTGRNYGQSLIEPSAGLDTRNTSGLIDFAANSYNVAFGTDAIVTVVSNVFKITVKKSGIYSFNGMSIQPALTSSIIQIYLNNAFDFNISQGDSVNGSVKSGFNYTKSLNQDDEITFYLTQISGTGNGGIENGFKMQRLDI